MNIEIVKFLYKKRVFLGFIFCISFLVFSKPISENFLLFGITLAWIGELIRLVASGYIIKTDELATYGPYSLVRHPLYLGSFIMGTGICISIFSSEYLGRSILFFLFYLCLFFGVYVPVLKREEEVMIEKYGKNYLDYKLQVPMLFPIFRRYNSEVKKKFSFKVFFKNKEYRALVGLIGVIVILLVKYIYL